MSTLKTKNKLKTISVTDTALLITNAGGRCSFNDESLYCNKILSDGRVNLGERAHIVGVNGPRAHAYRLENKNGYDNLIWLCRDHHKIIDHSENLDLYTVDYLREMKRRHELRIRTGRYPYYGTDSSVHDFSVLSCIFHFTSIHGLYSCVSSYPDINLNFFDIGRTCNDFREGNPEDLPLKDPILRRLFRNFEVRYWRLNEYFSNSHTVKEDPLNHMYTWQYSMRGEILIFHYLSSVEQLVAMIEKRFPQIMSQDLCEPF